MRWELYVFVYEYPLYFWMQTDDPELVERAKQERDKLNKFQNLFKGLKFFLNREVPREMLVFVIR